MLLPSTLTDQITSQSHKIRQLDTNTAYVKAYYEEQLRMLEEEYGRASSSAVSQEMERSEVSGSVSGVSGVTEVVEGFRGYLEREFGGSVVSEKGKEEKRERRKKGISIASLSQSFTQSSCSSQSFYKKLPVATLQQKIIQKRNSYLHRAQSLRQARSKDLLSLRSQIRTQLLNQKHQKLPQKPQNPSPPKPLKALDIALQQLTELKSLYPGRRNRPYKELAGIRRQQRCIQKMREQIGEMALQARLRS